MGWLFSCDIGHDKKALVAKLRKPERFGQHTLLKSCVIGNHHWYLLKTSSGQITIGLDLLAGGGKTMGWGYKDQDESCGPCALDCPITYLDLATEPLGHAAEWRERVRKYHANKVKPASGLYISYGEHQYKLGKPYAPRRGWWAHRVDDGSLWRLKAKQIANARVV